MGSRPRRGPTREAGHCHQAALAAELAALRPKKRRNGGLATSTLATRRIAPERELTPLQSTIGADFRRRETASWKEVVLLGVNNPAPATQLGEPERSVRTMGTRAGGCTLQVISSIISLGFKINSPHFPGM